MIVEAVVVAAVIAGGGFLARTFWKRRGVARDRKSAAGKPEERESVGGLSLGDVVLYLGDELWLAGAVELDEEGFVMKVFKCPGGREATHVVQLDRDAREVMLAREATGVAEGALPSELRTAGSSFTMRRRGSARLHSRGERVLGSATQGRYTWFTAAGGKVLVVIDPDGGTRLSLVGDSVPREMIELLPGSKESQPDPPGK
ncbi:MAG: hypothetical protein IT379_32725 [Deltaproteobacteria bacterium]|nr:hypothetical protein [Deltaproteobacteria bacterium]